MCQLTNWLICCFFVSLQVHRTEKQFTCHVCKLQFRHKNSLVRHLFQHSGERPFRCQNCESGFTSINRLKEHIKKRHPDTPAAKSIMEPIMAAPMQMATTTMATTSSTSTKTITRQYPPIAPAPLKVTPSYQPQTIMLPAPHQHQMAQNLPILTQGPNGTMILVSNPYSATPFMFHQPSATPQFYNSQFMFAAAPQQQQQPMIYGMPFFQSAACQMQPMQTPPTIMTSSPQIAATPPPQQQPKAVVEEITLLNEHGESQTYDILERAILEIPNLFQADTAAQKEPSADDPINKATYIVDETKQDLLDLQEKQLTNTTTSTVWCNICGKKYQSENFLKVHQRKCGGH
jgi:hypothetical protein